MEVGGNRIRLRAFGSPSLTRTSGGSEVPVHLQPKRLAILVFLLLAPGGCVRRGSLLATFWPDASESAARQERARVRPTIAARARLRRRELIGGHLHGFSGTSARLGAPACADVAPATERTATQRP